MKGRRPGSRAFAVYLAAALSLAYLGGTIVPRRPSPALRSAMGEAAKLMTRTETALRDCRFARGVPLDPDADPNATGLVGVEASEITTSAGRLEAKRTAANPAFGALVAALLHEAGVRRGDAVAVGASSSFPALIVATLAAAHSLGAEALVVSSLGASEWGGNVPGFTWLDMEDCLRAAGLCDGRTIARTIGGEADVGRDMDPVGRAGLEARLRAGSVPFVDEPDLARNVALRLALYRAAAGGRPLKAFVNVGGAWANLGTDAAVLEVAPGLARRVTVPPLSRRGVLQAMAADGVPVVHLLNVKGLCERYGLPWDPRPLPLPDDLDAADLYRRAAAGPRPAGPVLSAVYVLAVAVVLALGSGRRPL